LETRTPQYLSTYYSGMIEMQLKMMLISLQ